jgi:Domain of Unknown Function (DUF1206)
LVARAVFYALVTYGILKYALGVGWPSSSGRQSQDLTAALKHTGGQAIVAIAGVVVVGVSLYVMYRAYKLTFLKHLPMGAASPRTRRVVTRLGQVGGIARGFVFGTIGVFLVIAALGLLTFGLYSWCEARWRAV